MSHRDHKGGTAMTTQDVNPVTTGKDINPRNHRPRTT